MDVDGRHAAGRDAMAGASGARDARAPTVLRRVPWLFVAMVVVPVCLAAVYYLLIAAPLFVSEAKFVVRSRGQNQAVGLGSLLQSIGMPGGQSETDAYEVHEYMVSRDAVQLLDRNKHLRAVLDRPEADFIARFPRPLENDSFEDLFQGYKRFVTVGFDTQTGISTLRVQAFRAADAREIAEALLDGGETLVNRLNARAMSDAVDQAQKQVLEAESRGVAAQAALTDFRSRERLIDPDRSSVAGIELMGKLEGQLASLRAERAGLAASAPESPQLPVLDRRIAAFAGQLEAERTRTAGETDSLAPKMGEYERLTLERDLAVRTLEASVANLETARMEARRKELYLERIVSPDLPDKAERPRRLLMILEVLISALAAYAIVTLIVAGLREHRQQ